MSREHPPWRRRGRPPAPEDQVRPHRVVTFVTHAEMAKFEQICENEQKSLSAVTHQILSRSLRRRGRCGKAQRNRNEEEEAHA